MFEHTNTISHNSPWKANWHGSRNRAVFTPESICSPSSSISIGVKNRNKVPVEFILEHFRFIIFFRSGYQSMNNVQSACGRYPLPGMNARVDPYYWLSFFRLTSNLQYQSVKVIPFLSHLLKKRSTLISHISRLSAVFPIDISSVVFS